jgi:hypothetical protein
MTVGITPPSVDYVENGVTTTHAIPFQFFDDREIVVTRVVAGVETLLALGYYDVLGGAGDVGSIVKDDGGVNGATLRIERATARSQTLDLQQNADLPSDAIERELDRLAMVDQEQDLKIPTVETLQDIIAACLVAGGGITLTYDDPTGKLTIANSYDGEFIQDTIGAAIAGGPGVTVTYDDALGRILIEVDTLSAVANCLQLSGDQATGGAGIGGGGVTGEQIMDLVASFLVAGAGIGLAYNDAGDQLTISNTVNYSDEQARDAIGAALVGGANVTVTVNDAGDTITIACTALAASYRGLAVVAKGGAFNFDDTHGGKSILYTGGAAAATLKADAINALSDGWGTVIRNKGTGPLTIAKDAGVSLMKNGGTVSGAATIAQGGVATINRWGVDDLTINGNGVS